MSVQSEAFVREYRKRASWDSFFSRYVDNTKKCDSYEEAYNLTEKEHIGTYGGRCYANYNSFRNTKSRKLSKN